MVWRTRVNTYSFYKNIYLVKIVRTIPGKNFLYTAQRTLWYSFMNGKPIYFSNLCQICQLILNKILCIYFSAPCTHVFIFFKFGYHVWSKKAWIIALRSNLHKGTLRNLFCWYKKPRDSLDRVSSRTQPMYVTLESCFVLM